MEVCQFISVALHGKHQANEGAVQFISFQFSLQSVLSRPGHTKFLFSGQKNLKFQDIRTTYSH